MQAVMEPKSSSNMRSSENQRLGDKKVRDILTMDKRRRLVEVPYTASLVHTMNALVANQVVALPVAAPPGHWIGAGGSMILESDKQTGAVRKHYIGMVTMLDILAHIAGDGVNGGDVSDLDKRMLVPVSSIIGHCVESLSLWTLNPNTSILDCMEVFSKGIHRALVPLDGQHMENVVGVELAESASSYQMLTQMDLLRFLKAHDSELEGVMLRALKELEAVTEHIFGVSGHTKVINAIKCMRAASLNAVPIVEALDEPEEEHSQLVNVKGRALIGTFSAADLRGCPISQLQPWLDRSVVEFIEKLSTSPFSAVGRSCSWELVICYAESNLAEVIDKALTKHVHRVWVVDQLGLLVGLVSLTDMIRVARAHMLLEPS